MKARNILLTGFFPFIFLLSLNGCAVRKEFSSYVSSREKRFAVESRSAAKLLKLSREKYEYASSLNDIYESLYLADAARMKGEKKKGAIRTAFACVTLGARLPKSDGRPFLEFGMETLKEYFYPYSSSTPAEALYLAGVIRGVSAERYGTGLAHIQSDLLELFSRAVKADESLNCGAPHRELARLYFMSPRWPAGIGDKNKALSHASKALKICPDYPENILLLYDFRTKSGKEEKKRACEDLARARGDILKNITKMDRGPFWKREMRRYLEEIYSSCGRVEP